MTSQLFIHYTSTAGATGISQDGVLKSQDGVMLSTLKPESHSRDDILQSIYGNPIPPQFQNRADNIVYVDGSTLDSSKLTQVKTDLFKYSGDIEVFPSDVKDKPRCSNNRGGSSNWNLPTTTNTATKSSSSRSAGNASQPGGQLFYHYTSTAGANGIRKDLTLKSNYGVMLSTLKPENHSRDDILHSIHGSTIPPQFKNRADNIVYVEGSTLDPSKLSQIKPDLFKYSGDITISPNDVQDKPRCVGRQPSNGSTNANTTGSSGSSASQKSFYYYSNKSTAAKLKSSGQSASNCKVLLTTMEPESHYRNEILDALYGKNYDRNLYADWADWCTKIDASKLNASKLKKIRDEVYEYADSIKIKSSDVHDKPECTKNGSSSSAGKDDFLYHYTDSKGAQAIKLAGFLKKSGQAGLFGACVYMTNLKPDSFFRDDILKNNYGGICAAFKGRADFVVRVDQKNLDPNKLKRYDANITKDCSRKIFVYPDVINVNSSDVYDKPKCYRAI